MTSLSQGDPKKSAFSDASTDITFSGFDRRLAPAARLIEQGKLDWLCLDIFDTSIYRHVLVPADLFVIVGHELQKRGVLFPSETAESFFVYRTMAENLARMAYYQLHKLEEITLRQIYEFLPQKRFRIPVATVMALELETEHRLIHSNVDIFALIAHARRHNVKIAFISDTYFDRDFLLRLLQKGDPNINPDLLLASQEHGVSKGHGLFDVFLKMSGANPERVLHIGDNARSDVKGARERNIRTIYLSKHTHNFQKILDEEWSENSDNHFSMIDPQEGDFGLSWLRGRIGFQAVPDPSFLPWYKWGLTIMGPLLTYFIDWAAERIRALAAEHGEPPTVLCLMREGKLFAGLMHLRHPDIIAHETWINRHVALKAGLFDGTDDDIMNYLNRPNLPTVKKICSELHIPQPSEIDADAELSGKTLDAFKNYLKQPDIKERFRDECRSVRDRLLLHIEKQCPKGIRNSHLLLLDLGYSGTIQRSLQRVLDRNFDGNVQTYGLYLATRIAGAMAYPQLSTESWLATNGLPFDFSRILFRSPEPLEQACMASVGTLVGYDEHGHPVCEPNPLSAKQVDQIQAVQNGIRAFTALAPKLPSTNPYLIHHMRRLLIRAIALPTLEEAITIGGWHHDENFGNTHIRSLSVNTALGPLNEMPLSDVMRIDNVKLPWLFAGARRHSSLMAQRLYMIFSGRADVKMFMADDGDPIDFVAHMNYGNSTDSSIIPVSRTDLGIVRTKCVFHSRGRTPKALALTFGVTLNDFFSLKSTRLFYIDAKGKQAIIQENDFSVLKPFNVVMVAPNLFKISQPDGALIWQLPILPENGGNGAVVVEIVYRIMKN
jgi:FMN phosphatase YigB (HAD superfamily)